MVLAKCGVGFIIWGLQTDKQGGAWTSMDLAFSREDMAFRDEVRAFIAKNAPRAPSNNARGELTREDYLAWHKVLYKKGWVAPACREHAHGCRSPALLFARRVRAPA